MIQAQATQEMIPIDAQTLVKHGDSPTAIILAIAILLFLSCNGLTALIQTILQSKK
ncbi:MAG: hypothetical protein VKJ02_04000 [Snowella sp.]|nr:hypothetical protein [Snowella sp.]